MKLLLSVTLGSALCFVACKQEATNKKTPTVQKQSSNQDEDQDTNPDGDAAATTDSSGQAFYTGYDGKTDFSLLVPGFMQYTLDDNSIATLEEINVTLSEDKINELLADVKQENPDFDDNRFKMMLGRSQKAYKITPLKPGVTTLYTQRPNQGGGRGPGEGYNPWGNSGERIGIQLTVMDYTPEQVASGKHRYTTDGSGTLKACASCHETGAEGAPPHELGRIMEISDSQALQWITTGKLNGRVAKITHTWEFSSDDEKNGIVPYVRSLQTHDAEELTKLYFEEQLENFPGAPPPRNDGDGDGSQTSSSTISGS